MSSEQLVLMWTTKIRINLCEPYHFVLLAQKFQQASPTTEPSPTVPPSTVTVRLSSVSPSMPPFSAAVNNGSPINGDQLFGVAVGDKRTRRSTDRSAADETSVLSSSSAVINGAPSINDENPGRKRKRSSDVREQQLMTPTSQSNAALDVSNNQRKNFYLPISDHRQRSSTSTTTPERLNSHTIESFTDSVTLTNESAVAYG